MHYLLDLLKIIITKATEILCTGLIFTVFTAEPSADQCADALDGSGMEGTIAVVETSAENEDTSLELSLTADDIESGTIEVLIEPPTYAETYGSSGTDVQRNGNSVTTANAARETTAATTGNSSTAKDSYASPSANANGHNNSATASGTDSSSANTADGNTNSSSVHTAANTTDGNKTTAVSETDNRSTNTAANTTDSNKTTTVSKTDNSSANTTDSNKTTAVSEADNSSANTVANATNNNETAAADGTGGNKTYDHTAAHYADDNATLLRVEYLDENGKMVEYSTVTDFDKDTNSYTETVYAYDWDEEKEYVTRTDTYVNGELVSSETP